MKVKGLGSMDSFKRLNVSTRRVALKHALGVGYALAASPLMAQTAIRTSSVGLQTSEVMVEREGYKFPVYVAHPSNRSNLPVVLVISEIFGVHEYIADVARRFAHAGYCAIAPELFVRQGDPSEFAQLAKHAGLQLKGLIVPEAEAINDLALSGIDVHDIQATRRTLIAMAHNLSHESIESQHANT